jgi:nitrile hydratase subunit beta
MRFKPGDRVTVRVDSPPHHCRTPKYIQGKTGVVERVQGEFRNPEQLAYGGDGLPPRPLYLVRFEQPAVWPRYQGSPRDAVLVDLYEHWLNPAR